MRRKILAEVVDKWKWFFSAHLRVFNYFRYFSSEKPPLINSSLLAFWSSWSSWSVLQNWKVQTDKQTTPSRYFRPNSGQITWLRLSLSFRCSSMQIYRFTFAKRCILSHPYSQSLFWHWHRVKALIGALLLFAQKWQLANINSGEGEKKCI